MLKLFKHQEKAVAFFSKNERGLDLSDPGTGKTRTQIETFVRRKNHKAALVIAPRSLLRSAWEADFRKFAPQIKTSVATASNRKQAFEEKADVYITNVDAAVWLAKQPKKFFDRFDTLIIDELTAFKHHTSARSRAMCKIKKYFRYRYGLTGLIASNAITDVWHQVFLIDDGKRLGTSFYHFRNSTQIADMSTGFPKWTDKPGAETAVTGLIQEIVVRNKLEECIDIPNNNEFTLPYYMSAEQKRVYAQMEQHAIAAVKSGEIIKTVNAAGVMNKLLQIASGAAYTGGQVNGALKIATDRYELVVDVALQYDHSVVFFNWKHQKDFLIAELIKQKITHACIDGETSDKQRVAIVDDYQKGFYRVLLAHPQSVAHGLTLTRGITTIWASPTYNLEHWVQGNHRIYRAGQKRKTNTISIIAKDTIESKIMERLDKKNSRQVDILSILHEAYR